MKKLVVFFLAGFLTATAANAQEGNKAPETVYTIVEKMPQFPGGEEGLDKYLRESIVYPKAAIEQRIEGKVYSSFIIDEFGNLSNPEIKRSLGSGCDEEVLRVIRAMPRWTPGMQDGRAVKVQFNLPVEFKLN